MKLSGSITAVLLLTISSAASALESGGLVPPDPIQRTPYTTQPTVTEQELARADREDSGRGLEFVWLGADVGYEFVGLQTFRSKKLLPNALSETAQSGPVVGGGLGMRLLFLTLGGRFQYGLFSAWDLWSVNLEAGLHLPYGSLEPYAFLGGGYSALGAFDSRTVGGLSTDDLNINGWNLRGGIGLDYYVASGFSVGARVSGDVLFLKRAKFDEIPADAPDAMANAYGSDGKSIGGGATATAVLGLHF